MRKYYFTISNEATFELEEKKSRFIAHVMPAINEAEAQRRIGYVKAANRSASHNVYAWYIGGEEILQRFSDDGEPQGTAGLPVLEAIRRPCLEDVVLVVTRYFGGTLLGTAGLVKAYSTAATGAIETAGVIRKELCREISIRVEYNSYSRLKTGLEGNGFKQNDAQFSHEVNMNFQIPVDDVDRFTSTVSDILRGKAELVFGVLQYFNSSNNRHKPSI